MVGRVGFLGASGTGICSLCVTSFLKKIVDFSSKNNLGSAGHLISKTWTKDNERDLFLIGRDFCVFSGQLGFHSSHPCSVNLLDLIQTVGKNSAMVSVFSDFGFISFLFFLNIILKQALLKYSEYFFPWIVWQIFVTWLGQAGKQASLSSIRG